MEIEARIARIEADLQIRQLIARYCFAIDERRLEDLATLFTEGATVRSPDGVMNATSLGAIIRQFEGRFAALGPGAHYMHDVEIEFVGDGTREARGRVSGHAELMRNGRMMVCSLQYRDTYVFTASGWRFQERVIGFLYYVPIEDYPGILLRPDRNLAYGTAAPADWPEPTLSWQGYEEAAARAKADASK